MRVDGLEIEFTRIPLLVAAEDPEHARTFLSRLQPLASLGFEVPSTVLDGAEIRAREPALSAAVRAGLVIGQHCVVDPPALIAALTRRVAELGVELREGSELRDIDVEIDIEVDRARPRVVALRTSTGRQRCGGVVLAPGAWLAPVARLFGARLPVEAGKGYSFELRPARMPRHALMLLEPHVGCSPLGSRLRIAGTMEFSGLDGRVDRRRIDSIVRGAERMLDGWTELDEDSIWCGLRPIAPDGLPIIDRHPRLENVFVAGAYSMLGMTLAAPAARSLAEFVMSGKRPAELEPFRATRFGLTQREKRRPTLP
jgi:D-amino-acid dehydrogenase